MKFAGFIVTIHCDDTVCYDDETNDSSDLAKRSMSRFNKSLLIRN